MPHLRPIYRKYMVNIIPVRFLFQILVQLSQFMSPAVALMFCGRLGKVEFGAATMANTVCFNYLK